MENKNDIVGQYKYLCNQISERNHVASVMGYEQNMPEYVHATKQLILTRDKMNKELTAHYDLLRSSRVGLYETLNEFLDRMNSTLELDEDGTVKEEYFKLGIDAIDDEFFNGKGVFSNAFIAIGADSGVGKTSLALNIISSFAEQGVKSQFFSFEMGDRQFFNEVSPEAKNKLKRIAKSEYADNLTLDFHSRDINDLANSIQMRNSEGVRAFVIDSYLSIYAGADEFRKMKEVVDMLATLKKELGILIIIIAQISKSDSFNEIYDFHGGNTLKYESDVALFIKLVQGEEEGTKRHIHCEKNRIFEETAKKGIVTDYDRTTHKITKLADFKSYGGVGGDGKTIRSFTKGFGKKKD